MGPTGDRRAEPSVPVRRARGDDVDAIVSLVTAAYRGRGDEAGWTTESHLLDGQRTNPTEVRSALEDPGCELVVATERDAVVGVVRVKRRGTDGAAFGLFAVAPNRQSDGIGSRLLDEAERIARSDWSASWMELEVLHQRADLQAWYRRRGYTPTGRTEAFPDDDERFGRPRVLGLHFDVYRLELTSRPGR